MPAFEMENFEPRRHSIGTRMKDKTHDAKCAACLCQQTPADAADRITFQFYWIAALDVCSRPGSEH